MEPSSSLNILFILNPVSGGKNKIQWEPLIRDFFEPLHYTIELFFLTGKDDSNVIKQRIQQSSPQKVVAVGGDGTISSIAKLLMHTSIPMGVLRGGSANGMATELNIPADTTAALEVIINGSLEDCDVIKINNDDISIHLSDLGLNARMVKYFDQTSFRGMWGYARVFLKILWEGKLLKAHIEAENIKTDISAYMIVIANASKYGTGAVINPSGRIRDGKFELVIVRKISLIEMMKMFLNNKPFDPQKVEIFQTTKASITIQRPIHFQVDGEYKGKVRHVSAEIVPSALKLIVPTENPVK